MSGQSKYTAEVCPARAARIARRSVLTAIAGVIGSNAAWGDQTAVIEGRLAYAGAGAPTLGVVDLEVPGFAPGFEQVRLLVPSSSSEGAPRRGLVLLHGLGETHRASLALRAWSELYGAVAADERLRHPPVAPVYPRDKYWRPEVLREVNVSLAAKSYQGAILICPRTPNPSLAGNRGRLFDEYSAWLTERVVPAVARHFTTPLGALGLDGCSLGGYVAMEVFSRCAPSFRSFGTVQGALGEGRVAGYADRLTELSRTHPSVALRLASSERDPYLELNRRLSRRLSERGVPHTFDVDPGPHNQLWLRDVGTLRTLLWHDRQLQGL